MYTVRCTLLVVAIFFKHNVTPFCIINLVQKYSNIQVFKLASFFLFFNLYDFIVAT